MANQRNLHPSATNPAIWASSQITLTSHAEFPLVGLGETNFYAMASLKAPTLALEDKRTPIDMICVIDKSGSMGGPKMNLTKSALEFLVSQLDDHDTLGLICYDSNVSRDLDLIKMTKENKQLALDAISKIAPGSMTNLSGGLFEGLSMAEKRTQPNHVCSVLLLTDGLANEGLTHLETLTATVEKKLALCKDGVTVFTFGFGADHDSNMLRSLSTSGKGMYYFLETVDQIPISFADCLGGLQSVVAQNIKLTVEATNGSSIASLLTTTYKTTGALPGPSAAISLGDLYSEEERDVLFSFKLPALLAPADPFTFVTLTLEYLNIITASDEKVQTTGNVIRSQSPPQKPTRDLQVDMQLNRLAATSALEASRNLAAQGNLEEARKHLAVLQNQISASSSADMDYTKALSKDMDRALDALQTKEVYRAVGQQQMAAQWQSHAHQRSNKASANAFSPYQNAHKSWHTSKFH